MNQNKLYLFTNRFPYVGGEPFLETEITYLANKFEHVLILPLDNSVGEILELPENVKIFGFNPAPILSIKKLIITNYKFILSRFMHEIWFSEHRFKYLTQFKFNLFQLIGSINLAEQLMRNIEAHQIYYTYWCNEWGSALATANSKGLKGKFVTRMHGYDFDEQQNGRGYFSFRNAEIKIWNRIAQVSKYGYAYIKNRFNEVDNLTVSYLGVNNLGVNPSHDASRPYTLVSCSNFVPLKRVNLLIEILANLNVPFKWIHFGSGKGQDEIIELAKQKLKADSFEFRGQIKNVDLMKFYNNTSVDLFINVSELEGLPVSLMEAISFGIPIVGCEICGVPEIVNVETGLLLDKNFKPEIAAHKIEELLKEKARNVEYRKGIKDFYLENFNAKKNYEAFANSLLLE